MPATLLRHQTSRGGSKRKRCAPQEPRGGPRGERHGALPRPASVGAARTDTPLNPAGIRQRYTATNSRECGCWWRAAAASGGEQQPKLRLEDLKRRKFDRRGACSGEGRRGACASARDGGHRAQSRRAAPGPLGHWRLAAQHWAAARARVAPPLSWLGMAETIEEKTAPLLTSAVREVWFLHAGTLPCFSSWIS